MSTLTTHPAIPGPKGYPIIGSLPDLQQDRLNFFLNARREYGDVFRFYIGPRTVHVIAHPEGIKHVLLDNNSNYHKNSRYEKTHPLLGQGLLTSEDSFWLSQRRLIQPIFHRQRIASFAQSMTDSTHTVLRDWQTQEGEPLDVAREMMRLTLSIVSFTLFSTDVRADADRIGNALTVALEHTNRRMESFFDPLERFPTPANRQFKEALETLDSIVYGMIEARKHSGEDTGDLLSMLLSARDEETGEGMSAKQIRDEAMTIFLAGHETTANVLSWTFYLLSQHTTVYRKLAEEVDTVLAGETPTLEHLPRLSYTKQVIEESMRLYPPAWAIGRQALADDEVGGYRIPAGADVVISPYMTHRHPEFWPNPLGFDPERFAGEDKRHRFAYFPFGGGPRICIGSNFALMEAQLILATITQAYRLELLPGHVVTPDPVVTLRPKDGILMTLRRRA